MFDVFIIGGGPAGAAAGRLLASWGRSVQIAHRPAGSRTSLAESLPPSTRKLLAFLGLVDAVDAAGFHPNRGNIAFWGSRSRTTNSDAAGLHVSRAQLDEVLRGCARAAGAGIVGAVVRRVEMSDHVRVDYVTADGRAQTCRARYILDCSGRAGVVARRGWRQTERRYRTLAIAAEWESDDWATEEAAHTIVESYRDGWAWSVPLSATQRQFTVMVEPHRPRFSARSASSVLNEIYTRELAKPRGLSARVSIARQTGAPWACDASLYHAPRAAEGCALLVGDAASFIEPLSSAGVKKALTSAWRAAVVVNTCLARPEMAGAAMDFYDGREREVYEDCRRLSNAFFREAAAAYDDPFWSARSDGDENEQRGSIGASDAELARDPRVRAAFDRLRRSALVRLRPDPLLRVEAAATIEGREVVMRDALVLSRAEPPVRFAAGVNLPALVDIASRRDEVPDILAAYEAEIGPAPMHGLLTGLSLLVARRALIPEDSAL